MRSQATANPVMTGHAVQFMRAPGGFVGMRLFPGFSSAEQSSDYYVWKKENSLNIPTNIRHAPGTGFARTMPQLADDNFACKDYGHETPVPDQIRRKYTNIIDADISAIRRNTEIIKVNHELRVKALVTGAGVNSASPGTKWDQPNSDPRGDINTVKETIRKAIGMRPNLMVISEPVRLMLMEHPKVADRVKHTTTVTSLAILAAYLEIQEIIVAEQIINQANEGQTLSAADIWGDDVLLAYVNPAPDLMVPTFGRTFYWSQFGTPGAEDVPIRVESYRDEPTQSDVHRSQHFTDEKIVQASAGYRISDVLT